MLLSSDANVYAWGFSVSIFLNPQAEVYKYAEFDCGWVMYLMQTQVKCIWSFQMLLSQIAESLNMCSHSREKQWVMQCYLLQYMYQIGFWDWM